MGELKRFEVLDQRSVNIGGFAAQSPDPGYPLR